MIIFMRNPYVHEKHRLTIFLYKEIQSPDDVNKLNTNHYINLHINVIYLEEVSSGVQPYNYFNLYAPF